MLATAWTNGAAWLFATGAFVVGIGWGMLIVLLAQQHESKRQRCRHILENGSRCIRPRLHSLAHTDLAWVFGDRDVKTWS